jgi:hypothetical protein
MLAESCVFPRQLRCVHAGGMGRMPAQHQSEPERSTSAKNRTTPATSAVLDDGVFLELVYDPDARQTWLALWERNTCRIVPSHVLPSGDRLVPYSPRNNLIRHEVVLLPSGPEEYGSEAELLAEIRGFIHRYVDLSPSFERLASCYVLFTWLYDAMNELPYLRIRGDYGSGKTRFLLTAGSLCYKPVFASGASTVSPIFHILDAFRGTLIIDEGDFRWSDERAEIVKILNNGNVRGLPVLRAEATPSGEFNPRAFQVFGPKIVATRGIYQDRALESRFITEEAGARKLRDDIPINLPPAYKGEALRLRNKLLLYRFRNLGKVSAATALFDPTIEPRLNQIFIPLASVVSDPGIRAELRERAREYHRELVADRGMDVEAQVLEIIRELQNRSRLSVNDITASFAKRFGSEHERPITNKWIGFVIRRRLNLKTHKSHGTFVIPFEEGPKLERLYERYGLIERHPSAPVEEAAGDIGDVGDVAQAGDSQE